MENFHQTAPNTAPTQRKSGGLIKGTALALTGTVAFSLGACKTPDVDESTSVEVASRADPSPAEILPTASPSTVPSPTETISPEPSPVEAVPSPVATSNQTKTEATRSKEVIAPEPVEPVPVAEPVQEALSNEDIARAGLNEYIAKFPCAAADRITFTFGDPGPQGESYTSGPLATTTGNTITLRPDLEQNQIRNIMLHESGHACKNVGVRHFPQPFESYYDDGARIYGAEGFVVYYENPGGNGEYGHFMYIEEGVAEYVAEGFADYTPLEDRGYAAVSALTAELANMRGLNRENILRMQQNSDFLSFVGIVYGKQPGEIDARTLESLVLAYQDAFQSHRSPSREELAANYGIN